ncbi:TonB-dependent receptor [Paucibacter sp. TC2R-5]|uniref:TonB-dependent receptor plug domain-containing protein n=1 Tax=Paucibacter sp. TC2R-5 TaxID=2893555 RepID=UPI0021E504EF|nr:TonB-dependent receptor [Paucibacter sp. TC2R-5]MCV2360010.1 TonB-dependent receptor [Paucibacter sp. TC2R-5]
MNSILGRMKNGVLGALAVIGVMGISGLLWPALAEAQSEAAVVATPAQPAVLAPAATLQRVEVQGDGAANALSARRESVGALLVVNRDELLRQGDTRLSDALRRVPGISIVSQGSRGPEIRMSGLGGGYTQILLNGEPVPPGFSLESISPEAIERIEVSRSASVEQSSQAIAGSINIVTRGTARQAQRDLKLGLGSQLEQPTLSADMQLGDRDGGFSWGLGLGLAHERQLWPMLLDQQALDAQGVVVQAYRTDKREYDRSNRLTLSPRATWTLSPQQTLSTDHLLRLSRSKGGAIDDRYSSVGLPPEQAHNDLALDIRALQLRSRLNWSLSEADGSKWELKLGYTRLQRDSNAQYEGYDFSGRWIRDAQVDSLAVDQGWSLAGRHRRALADQHSLSTGWDAEENRRSEDRLQHENPLPGGLPVENLDEIYDARIRRLAFFVQDEIDISKAWQATLGLRWEALQTISSGNVFETVNKRSSVLSPVLQVLWRVPASKDQLRMGLARSYKAPTPRELTPRRFVANNNSPTTPDLQGNPDLLPELAWGLDAGWTHPLSKSSLLSVSGYLKRIEQVIVSELIYQNGHWVERRANQGQAWVQGVELEGKLSVQELLGSASPAAPALDLRANLGLNQSRVKAVPGPDNRLAQQTPLSLNLGFDHRPVTLPLAGIAGALSWGGNLNITTGGLKRLAVDRWADKSSNAALDFYAAWKPEKQSQWRLSLSNLLHPDQTTQRRVLAEGLDHRLEERLQTGANLRLLWERSL